MAPKNFAEIDTGFPIYGLRFLNNHTLLACGGGGEGANGIPNKVTAVRCSFTVSDKTRRLQKFREITLPSNEDSPMCVEFCGSSAENSRYSIFVGCNQSTELIRSMNINNNLRKYTYTEDEHLQFSDAVQFDDSLSVESIGEYPKIVHLSADGRTGGMMTSRIPSEIFVFSPETLELKLRFKPSQPSEIKDFHLCPRDGSLTYVTASFIETIATNSGTLLSSSSTADKKTAKVLGKYFFSKVRYIDSSRVIITGALRNGKGAAVLEYNTDTRKVTREKVVSSKIKGIVAIDVSGPAGLFAVAGNDFSVSLINLADFRVVKTYTKLHKFAVTCLSFSPDGKKLATGSASNTLNVLLVGSSSGGFFSLVYSVFRFLFLAVLVAVFASFVQKAHESGDLDQYIELSKVYGAKALTHAQHYQEIGLELSQKYGKVYYELGQHYGKIGLDLAKEQGLRGLDLLKEQLNKQGSEEKEQDAKEADVLPDWASVATETASTVPADIVKEHTKDVHELTKGPGEKDTLSIISQATQLSILRETVQSEGPPGEEGEEKETLGASSSVAPSHIEDESVSSSVEDISETQHLTSSETLVSKATISDVTSEAVATDSDDNVGTSESMVAIESEETVAAEPETATVPVAGSDSESSRTSSPETPQSIDQESVPLDTPKTSEPTSVVEQTHTDVSDAFSTDLPPSSSENEPTTATSADFKTEKKETTEVEDETDSAVFIATPESVSAVTAAALSAVQDNVEDFEEGFEEVVAPVTAAAISAVQDNVEDFEESIEEAVAPITAPTTISEALTSTSTSSATKGEGSSEEAAEPASTATASTDTASATSTTAIEETVRSKEDAFVDSSESVEELENHAEKIVAEFLDRSADTISDDSAAAASVPSISETAPVSEIIPSEDAPDTEKLTDDQSSERSQVPIPERSSEPSSESSPTSSDVTNTVAVSEETPSSELEPATEVSEIGATTEEASAEAPTNVTTHVTSGVTGSPAPGLSESPSEPDVASTVGAQSSAEEAETAEEADEKADHDEL